MSEPASRPFRAGAADPLLEFPSERDPVGSLTRRLRVGPIALGPAPVAVPEPDPEWESESEPDSGLWGRAATPEPLIRPAAPPVVSVRWQTQDDSPSPDPSTPRMDRPVLLAVGLGVVAVLVVVTGAYVLIGSNAPAAISQQAAPEVIESRATVTSRPDGAHVLVDGVDKGLTPLAISLPVGEYRLELVLGDERVTLPLVIREDTAVAAHVELAAAAAAAAIEAAAAAEAAAAPPVTSRRASGPAAGPAVGWVTIDLPVDLLVRENGTVIGSTAADRLMLPAGRHELELTSEALEFRTVVDVTVAAGQTHATPVALPNGTLAVSAWPWADVFVDGQAVGTTPLGSLSVPIGTHDIVWRHPQLGERQETVTVTARTPTRVGIDFYRDR